ncbi:alpha/beta hydrolase, partial [Bacteroidota bacterium]
YGQSERSYPAVYLLHGYTDDETAWVQFGEINHLADKAINEGIIPSMIIAMPDAGVTWYANNYDGSVNYENFFFQEFIPHIESEYRIRRLKEYRGIAGLSMGGYGTTLYALKHPDMFTAATPLSAAIYPEVEVIGYDQERWDRQEGLVYGPGLKGKKRLTDHWKANNPFHIVNNSDLEKIKSVRWYFDCGDDDFLYRGNSLFHIFLRDKEIPHEFRIRDGEHNWEYWRTGIIDALQFIGKDFHR